MGDTRNASKKELNNSVYHEMTDFKAKVDLNSFFTNQSDIWRFV